MQRSEANQIKAFGQLTSRCFLRHTDPLLVLCLLGQTMIWTSLIFSHQDNHCLIYFHEMFSISKYFLVLLVIFLTESCSKGVSEWSMNTALVRVAVRVAFTHQLWVNGGSKPEWIPGMWSKGVNKLGLKSGKNGSHIVRFVASY